MLTHTNVKCCQAIDICEPFFSRVVTLMESEGAYIWDCCNLKRDKVSMRQRGADKGYGIWAPSPSSYVRLLGEGQENMNVFLLETGIPNEKDCMMKLRRRV